MTVDNFIKNYKSSNNKEQFWSKHIKTQYIDVLTKSVYAESIVDVSNHITVGERRIFKSNALSTHLAFTMRLVDLYTDIDVEFQDAKFIEQYDKLNKIGLIEEILSVVPKKERLEFNTILQMKTDDLYQNEYSVPALLYSIKESLSMSSDMLGKAFDSIDFEALQKNK